MNKMVGQQGRSLPIVGVIAMTLAVVPRAEAIVWADPDAKPPTEQVGPMKHTGRVLYSRLGICGGSCIWIGERWVLTSRHGTEPWSAKTLRVDFPAHGKTRYQVRAIHLPENRGVDLALLELDYSLSFSDPPRLDSQKLLAGASIRLGGFGKHGPAGNAGGASRFHWGTNVLDSCDEQTARFSLGQATVETPREALPALFDSGSPIFSVKRNGVGGERRLLAGISVRVSHGSNPKVGDHAIMTSLSSQAAWIRQIAPSVSWEE